MCVVFKDVAIKLQTSSSSSWSSKNKCV